jgi:hypothetical protein
MVSSLGARDDGLHRRHALMLSTMYRYLYVLL